MDFGDILIIHLSSISFLLKANNNSYNKNYFFFKFSFKIYFY